MIIASIIVFTFLVLALELPAFCYAGTENESSKLAELEVKYFGRSEIRRDPDQRLDRLEKFVFGQATTHSSEEQRINKLLSAQGSTQLDKIAATPPKAAHRKSSKFRVTSQYPKVTRLESVMLSETHESEPIDTRLARLESKAFGSPCPGPDLCLRTERLMASVNIDEGQFLRQASGTVDPDPRSDLLSFGSGMYGAGSNAFNTAFRSATANSCPVTPTESNSRVIRNNSGQKTLTDKITELEIRIQGSGNAHQSLEQRVATLEKTVWGHVNGAQPFTVRVDQLMKEMEVGQINRPVAQTHSSNANSLPVSQTVPQATATKRSFLGKIGKGLATFGSLALDVLAGEMGGPYSYGYSMSPYSNVYSSGYAPYGYQSSIYGMGSHSFYYP